MNTVVQTKLQTFNHVIHISRHGAQGHEGGSGSSSCGGAGCAVAGDESGRVRAVEPVEVTIIRVVVIGDGIPTVVRVF